MSLRTELKKLEREYRSKGWTITHTSRHTRWVPPDPSLPVIYASATPSDHRALKNHRALLKRCEAPTHSRYN